MLKQTKKGITKMKDCVINGLIEVPEICRDLDVPWAKYEPPGGIAWRDYFVNQVRPVFENSIAEAKKDLKNIKEAIARRGAIRKGLEDAKAIVQQINELGAIEDNGINPSRLIQLVEWSDRTLSLANGDLFTVDEQNEKVSVIEADIKYMTIVQDYFSTDFELDAVLYAMYKVAPKYKAKLFRHVMRLLPIVETNRKLIESSDSFIKSKTYDLIKPCIDELDKCYSTLSVSLRKMKKAAAKGLPDFWEHVV